jgi:hypothetical protein
VEILKVTLFLFGYPASIIVIARWLPVVREQRVRWLMVHHSAVAAIVAGWAISGDAGAIAVNATWLTVSTIWYVRAGSNQAMGETSKPDGD